MFDSIIASGAITIQVILICMASSIIEGLIISMVYKSCGGGSKNFVVTLAMLPVIVMSVILMVNGNLGAGVAVAGAFSLVRFRSAAGTSKDICGIFFAMAVGLAAGMGYIAFSIVITVIVGLLMLVLFKTSFGGAVQSKRDLKVTIPEDLDYEEIFDDIFKKYTESAELIKTKTTNMGSMFELDYEIVMKKDTKQKSFIDEIRCRNGNLTVSYGRPKAEELQL
ncbi:MAG: DUF4956 domain-containing protein [Candidatus Metalachnospira sp.]|nr:DUF4956 domain-containing protein [Candidatus Metalachnospira sp.]